MDMSKSFLAKSWRTLFYSIVIVNEKMRVHDSTLVPFVYIVYNLYELLVFRAFICCIREQVQQCPDNKLD